MALYNNTVPGKQCLLQSKDFFPHEITAPERWCFYLEAVTTTTGFVCCAAAILLIHLVHTAYFDNFTVPASYWHKKKELVLSFWFIQQVMAQRPMTENLGLRDSLVIIAQGICERVAMKWSRTLRKEELLKLMKKGSIKAS